MAASKARTRKVKKINQKENIQNIEIKNANRHSNPIFGIVKSIFVIILCVLAVYFVSDGFNFRLGGDMKNTTAQHINNNVEEEPATQGKPLNDNTASVNQGRDKTGFQSSVCPELRINDKVLNNGQRIKVKKIYQSKSNAVRIYQIDNFLTKSECDGLSNAHLRVVKKSEEIGPLFCFSDTASFRKYLKDASINEKVSPKDYIEHTTCVNETLSSKLQNRLKFSYSTAFYPGESKFSLIYEKRIENLSGLLASHGGKFQITSYPQNIGYKKHTDCTLNSNELRDRYATTLVYLQDVREGGETIFNKIGIKVKPKQGRLILWTNMDNKGNCDPLSAHEAAPVIKGRKYILQRWYYYKNFESLGKRPMETELPTRKPLQPRVSCDTYEEGSCRWYDEWGYDHLITYNQIKHKLV